MYLLLFLFFWFLSSFFNLSHIIRTASVIASAGYASQPSVIEVSISSVSYSEYSTGLVKNVTDIWKNNSCKTKAYSTFSKYINSKSSCLLSNPLHYPPSSTQSQVAVCQGFVTSIDYEVMHSTSSYGIITSINAAVIVTDVPLFYGTPKVAIFENYYDGFSPGNFPGYSRTFPSVSINQAFSVTFFSVDTSQANNANGNIVKR